MKFDIEDFNRHFVHSLTSDDKSSISEALGDWSKSFNYYSGHYPQDILQGDALSGVAIRHYDTGAIKEIKAVVLSNSCSIAPENKRDRPASVVVAPIVKVEEFRKLLLSSGAADVVERKVAACILQEVHNIFYLPKGGSLQDDHFVFFDRVHSIPLSKIVGAEGLIVPKLASLSQAAFYLLTFKISVFYCRLQENVDRDNTIPYS